MRYFLGVDPDLSSTACAVVDETGKFNQGWLCKSLPDVTQQIKSIIVSGDDPGKTVTFVAGAVEAQQIIPRRAGQKFEIDPMDLIRIGQIAGACVGLLLFADLVSFFPLPVEWKGSVPKEIHQMRVLLKAGFPREKIKKASGYCYVEGTEFKKGDWKHLADAIGLAQYAAERCLREKP